jgi:hypothetical protein
MDYWKVSFICFGSSAEAVQSILNFHICSKAGITYDSLEIREYDSQDEEDSLEQGQVLFAMTRGDKIELDQYIGICEKVMVS